MSDTQQSHGRSFGTAADPDVLLTSIPTNVRHFLWNDDYIELLAHKLELQTVKNLVEVGSGLWYLAGLFGLYMKPGSTVHGFDTDPAAIREAQERASKRPFSVNFKFQVGDALALPLADGDADLAICHHVLANMSDPVGAIREMARVVRPGGRVVAFEPNNLAQSLILDSVAEPYGVEDRLRQVRYQLYYETGKRLLGRGDDSIGNQVPRLFHEAGLHHIEVRHSDKAAALVPPYDTEEKRARAHEVLSWLATYEVHRAAIRECFLAGGGTPAEFDSWTAWELERNARICEQIRAETFVHPGGLMTYIVMGQK